MSFGCQPKVINIFFNLLLYCYQALRYIAVAQKRSHKLNMGALDSFIAAVKYSGWELQPLCTFFLSDRSREKVADMASGVGT